MILIILYPFPQADNNFWKVKYDHDAAKHARAAKKTERKAAKMGTSKKKKPSASDLLRLEDSSSDEEEVIFKFLKSLVITCLTFYPFRRIRGTVEQLIKR